MKADTGYIGDPEPWVHRWPNDLKGVRSAQEKCAVEGCTATKEPRSLEELNKQPFMLRRLRLVFRNWRERASR